MLALGAKAVLMKGGHGSGAESVDLLIEPNSVARLAAERVTRKTPTAPAVPCRRPSLRASPKACSLAEAVREAKAYITAAIIASDRLKIGHGHGPVHHFHHWWGARETK